MSFENIYGLHIYFTFPSSRNRIVSGFVAANHNFITFVIKIRKWKQNQHDSKKLQGNYKKI
jgi:hypothetical protein